MEFKGIKEGILISIENQDWVEAKQDLIDQIEAKQDFFEGAHLVLDVRNHVLRATELGELRDTLSDHGVILTGVISMAKTTQETAQLLGLNTKFVEPKVTPGKTLKPLDTVLPGEPAVLIERTMRSGFKVAYQGHVVVIGDVNPGAEIIASGCVVVWGRLRGTVHAGADGDDTAKVCALDLSPMQLRIASLIATTPQDQEKPQPEVASIIDAQIIAEPWQY
jgi:septum site-determining protein MinC